MRPQLAPADQVIAPVAATQHGIVTFAQLVGPGLAPRAISHRAAAGKLHRVYRGVYAAGHTALSDEGRWFAAVAACGELAVLSHRSAAELWRLLPLSTGPIHVTVVQVRRKGPPPPPPDGARERRSPGPTAGVVPRAGTRQ